MTLTDTDLRDALHRATRDVASPPSMAERVRRGGRRRLLRRRSLVAAGVAVVVGATGASAVVVNGYRGGAAQVAAPLTERPTRGDLAGDRAYLDAVRKAWRERIADSQVPGLTGAAHVVWAGTTPAGRAAMVTERTTTNDSNRYGWWAFVVPGPAGPTVLQVAELRPHSGDAYAVLLGPARDCLLVIDSGLRIEYSTELRFAPDGRVLREFRPVRFHDGAAALRVPSQNGRISLAIRKVVPAGEVGFIEVGNAFPDPVTGTVSQPQHQYLLDGSDPWWEPGPQFAAALEPYLDESGLHAYSARPTVRVRGATPDGRHVVVNTVLVGTEPPRLVVMRSRPDGSVEVVGSRPVDPAAALWGWFRLPDRQGILVVAPAAEMRYRTQGGAWQVVQAGAALLPPDATDVEVRRPDGAGAMVPLG